eukprot:ANDGO_05090.mRNA.1 hypothetical protein
MRITIARRAATIASSIMVFGFLMGVLAILQTPWNTITCSNDFNGSTTADCFTNAFDQTQFQWGLSRYRVVLSTNNEYYAFSGSYWNSLCKDSEMCSAIRAHAGGVSFVAAVFFVGSAIQLFFMVQVWRLMGSARAETYAWYIKYLHASTLGMWIINGTIVIAAAKMGISLSAPDLSSFLSSVVDGAVTVSGSNYGTDTSISGETSVGWGIFVFLTVLSFLQGVMQYFAGRKWITFSPQQ